MRIFGFLDRKKQIAPSSRSSVHPTSYGQDVYCVKGEKIKELLGAFTPQECQEVDNLLNIKSSWQVDPSSFGDDDDESVDDDSIEKDEDKRNRIIAMPQQKGISDLTAHVELAIAHPAHKSPSTKPSEEHAPRKPCSIDMKPNSLQVPAKISLSNQSSEDCVTRKPCSTVDVTTKVSSVRKYREGRPAKLTCVNDKAVAVVFGTTSERITAPHPSRIRGKKNASCVESFPLPPPFEKHYLPIPQMRASEEVISVAHPLPQPPLTLRTSNGCVIEHFDVKGQQAQMARAVSLDPPKKLTLKQKTSQFFVGGFPMPTQGLPSTPPTTPLPQAHRTSQNTLPTTTGMPLYQTPQSTPPTTPRKQLHQAPQNTPPITPRLPLNPQVSVNITHNAQSPPPSNRQSPRLTTHSPPHFPSQHAYSPPCSPLPRSLCPRNWTKGVILGQGTFGTVHEGWNLEDGSFFAVKVSSREDISPEIQQEVDVLSKLEHPNIVRYLGSSIEDNRLCIFLELVRMGSLDSILRKYKRFEDHNIRSYTRQILLGLEYLHGKKTIHRDIKCGNILVDVNGQVKLSDFGIAKQVGESLASSLKGTPLYMAPEVLMTNENSKSSYSFPADIWSLGCTVLELADGKPPWSDLKGFGFYFKVKNKELPPMPKHLSPEGRDFICCCLQYHPEDRPTASELLQHPFVFNVATPEPFFLSSPPSPLSPKLWPPQSSSSTWACGHCYPSSPSQATCFDQVLGGSQRAQTLIHGR